jgi:dipeptidyl-peptidase 4
MTILRTVRAFPRPVIALLALHLAVPAAGMAQDRLRAMPGFEQHQRMAGQISGSFRSGALTVAWHDGGRTFEYSHDGRHYRYDVAARRATEIGARTAPPGTGMLGRGGVERGRQFESAASPDGRQVAFYRDHNLWIRNADGSGERAITTEGNASARIKYGSASWVYGEELRQNTAIWWNPAGTKVAYYRFDESGVQDYYLQLGQTGVQSSIDTEAYPKAGTPNPIVDIYVHDVASGQSTRIAVRDGQPFTNDVVGHYAYAVGWSPDGAELTLNRTNRRQNIMEFTACSPATGACRVIVREEWPASWTANHPPIQFLADNNRFLWISERNGFRNIYLYDMTGRLHGAVTNHRLEVANIVHVDESAGTVWYMARSGDNHMKLQLHRVGLDGRGDRRLTDPAFNHSVSMAPDGRHFIAVSQTAVAPPVTRLHDAQGRPVSELATSDLTRFREHGFREAELFTFTAADGVTELHGTLHKPHNFDPSRRYPVLLSIYGGPGATGAREAFTTPNALTEYGFLVVTLDLRSASGRGKQFMDAIYEKLGVVEVDDMAAGIRALGARPYVDGSRVGVFGTSYGGYVSALALLRYPDVFQAASASAAVTDWRHYDTIYTERYMWIPQENAAGYDAGSAMTYAADLRGRLMLFYGTADNNVHPSNTMQLIAALQQAGKSFEVQVGPDRGHTGINQQRMMEFFIENLVLGRGAAVSN